MQFKLHTYYILPHPAAPLKCCLLVHASTIIQWLNIHYNITIYNCNNKTILMLILSPPKMLYGYRVSTWMFDLHCVGLYAEFDTKVCLHIHLLKGGSLSARTLNLSVTPAGFMTSQLVS